MKHEALEALLRDVGASQAFGALAELLPDAAVFAVDRDRSIVFWSEGATRLLGFSASDVIGQHCLKANRCAQCIAGCGIAERGELHDAALSMYRADGSRVEVRKHARSFTDEDGQFLGGVELLRPAPSAIVESLAPALPVLREPQTGEVASFHGILTRDHRTKELFATLKNVSHTDVTVLVRGESGAGKELFARAIHEESQRRTRPFLAINCAAMAPTLLESELFGHERGAFTGASHTHHGLFERADGGTLFLDEVAELPLELQAKLLRVLEEQTFFRVGGAKAIHVDVRIVSATHRSLRAEVAARRFREDLMYRLRVVPIFLPALRERRVDIPLLVERFLATLNERGPRRVTGVAPEAMRVLFDGAWPGNVRELKNAVEYAFAVGTGPLLRYEDLPPELRGQDPMQGAPVVDKRGAAVVGDGEDTQRRRIEAALATTGGHVGRAADLLGISRPTLWRWRKRLGV
jgi:two-component system, NtrC family, response regulator AtoC